MNTCIRKIANIATWMVLLAIPVIFVAAIPDVRTIVINPVLGLGALMPSLHLLATAITLQQYIGGRPFTIAMPMFIAFFLFFVISIAAYLLSHDSTIRAGLAITVIPFLISSRLSKRPKPSLQ